MILVINTGSSSIKMALIEMPSGRMLAEGMAERLGEAEALLAWKADSGLLGSKLPGADHHSAMQHMLATLFAQVDRKGIRAVGHRVVHGGERFVAPTLLDAVAIAEIDAISHLAPLHNPANLIGIRAAMDALSEVPHIAVFDTAFHHTMPKHTSLYAVPYSWYSDYGVRRYGFHGTSHHFVATEAVRILGRDPTDCRLLTAHLGNGCSVAAVRNGLSVDTSMGLTPLEGLVMGTRSGDVDPGLHDFIARQSGMSLSEITEVLNRESGLLGISGLSNDMRTLLEAAEDGNGQAALAVDIFCYRLAKVVAGLAVALDRVDAIVFTGGIGEHAAEVRSATVRHLGLLGAELDEARNREHGRHSEGHIGTPGSLPLLVVATHEETMIARYAFELVAGMKVHA